MYEAFVLQAFLLGIESDRLRRRLFEHTTPINLEEAISLARAAEATSQDLKTLKPDQTETVNALRKGQTRRSNPPTDKANSLIVRGKCGNCGQSHPPRQCPAYGQQCRTCSKFNHYSKVCRSKKQVHAVEEVRETNQSDTDSDESVLCIQIKQNKSKLLAHIDTRTTYGSQQTSIEYQLDLSLIHI